MNTEKQNLNKNKKKKFAHGWENANYGHIGVKVVENLN